MDEELEEGNFEDEDDEEDDDGSDDRDEDEESDEEVCLAFLNPLHVTNQIPGGRRETQAGHRGMQAELGILQLFRN